MDMYLFMNPTPKKKSVMRVDKQAKKNPILETIDENLAREAKLIKSEIPSNAIASLANKLKDKGHDGNLYKGSISAFGEVSKDSWESIRKSVEEAIQNDKNSTNHAKNIQEKVLSLITANPTTFSVVGSNPTILQMTLEKVLGKDLLQKLSDTVPQITFNVDGGEVEYIKNNGYTPITHSTFIEEHAYDERMSVKDVELHNDLYQKSKDGMPFVEVSSLLQEEMKPKRNKDRAKHWLAVLHKLGKENEYFDLEYHHQKRPVYLDYIPNSEGKGLTFNGDASFTVNPDLLVNMTGNGGDYLFNKNPIAKIYSMDHLKNLGILRAILSLCDNDEEVNSLDWASLSKSVNDEPIIQLHYHSPYISKDDLILTNDPNSAGRAGAKGEGVYQFISEMSKHDVSMLLDDMIHKYSFHNVKLALEKAGVNVGIRSLAESVYDHLIDGNLTVTVEHIGDILQEDIRNVSEYMNEEADDDFMNFRDYDFSEDYVPFGDEIGKDVDFDTDVTRAKEVKLYNG